MGIKIIIKLMYYVVFIPLIYMILLLTYFIFGFFPFVNVKKLTNEDVANIKKDGILHKTTKQGLKGIINAKVIKGSKGKKTYSTHFRPAAYFFANAYVKKGEDFNFNFKYKYAIDIQNLSDKQIENLQIRAYDSAVIYMGDFNFEEQNVITVKELEKKRYNLAQKIGFILQNILAMLIPNKYMVSLLICGLISTCICYPIYYYTVYAILQIILKAIA